MADNIDVTPGTGKTVATDDVGGAQYQQVKINIGADGTATALTGGAGAVASGTLRTTLGSDDPAVVSLAALQAAAVSTGPVLAPTAATPVKGAITTAMTGTTRTAVTGMGAPGVGLYNYITTIVISNSSSTVGTDVTLNDGDTTTVMMTIPAAINYGGAVITLPVPLKQTTSNTALYAANVTTGSSIKVSVVGYTGA